MRSETMSEIKIFSHGFVRLDDAMADDLSVVNAARVSFAKRSSLANGVLSDKDAGLIRYLMKNRHGTPFEHNAFRFHICAPIFVFREWQRHRIGSFNEMSGRYTELRNEFYVPEEVRQQVGTPGAYTYVAVSPSVGDIYRDLLEELCRDAYHEYSDALDAGVAKELARLFLPVNIYSEMYWTVNARSLMNFLSLRNHEHAMFEIRVYAQAVEDMFAKKMPQTHKAFLENERMAP